MKFALPSGAWIKVQIRDTESRLQVGDGDDGKDIWSRKIKVWLPRLSEAGE